MRTTVTLEDDVAAALARLEKQRGLSAKEVINTAVRAFITGPIPQRLSVYRTPVVDLGPCLIGSLDDVGDALAHAEGDDFR